jgi:hypothetical protein
MPLRLRHAGPAVRLTPRTLGRRRTVLLACDVGLMHLVYFSHSYRKGDAAIVRHFAGLMRAEGLVPVLDPPSDTVNAARLQRHLRDSDGMVVILTQRDDGVSRHILFEAALCLESRKPIVVFTEDVLDVPEIPSRILHRTFSRRWYFRQLREHAQAMRIFRGYLGQEPPPRYQPHAMRRSCIVLGSDVLSEASQAAVHSAVVGAGYRVVCARAAREPLQRWIDTSEQLACADVALAFLDAPDASSNVAIGLARASLLPVLSFTSTPLDPDATIPSEYRPRIIDSKSAQSLTESVLREFDVYEQAFVGLDSEREADKYVQLLLQIASPVGQYDAATRGVFVKELVMGDQYKTGQAGAVGPHSHAHEMTFNQVWSDRAAELDLTALAAQLRTLRAAMLPDAARPEVAVAIGEVAQAELAAAKADGSAALQHLAKAGKWALETAEKIGVALAAAAIKASLGM